MFCTQCGNQFEQNDRFCEKCGFPIRAKNDNREFIDTYEEPLSSSDGIEAEDFYDDDEEDEQEYINALVGSKANVYIEFWDRSRFWNWSAFWMGFYWMLYRKMYLYSLLTLVGLFILMNVLYRGLFSLDESLIQHPLENAIFAYLIMKFSIGIIGNSLYKLHVTRKISNMHKELDSDESLSIKDVTATGGTHVVLPALLFSIQLLCYAIVLLQNDGNPFKSSSTERNQQQSSQYAIRDDGLSDYARGITGANWEDQVGYDRLFVFVNRILSDWREQGADLELLGNNRSAESELWTQMVIEYFHEPGYEDHTLIDAMEWVAEQWPTLMASR
ncbi:DUF2628 domain-containing protein [Cohnella sp. WQ 127256]|uniref:DUF2628 domain-containing protein n=1 Tax=Cohnella sp. WQ 127256 TaxID=2938790 RepID=UPI002118CA88|nr:DUF2628 domain-containing protein [Cohnella sp. WQ 127256]